MKYLLIATLAFMLSGCGYTLDYCKEKQYKGIVMHSNSDTPDTYCSDGKIINNNYYTNSGEKSIENFTYLEFKD